MALLCRTIPKDFAAQNFGPRPALHTPIRACGADRPLTQGAEFKKSSFCAKVPQV